MLIAGVIEPTLHFETTRSTRRPSSHLTAYDAYLRAYAMLFTSGAQIPQALILLEKAIALDTDYGPALALAAICCFRVCADGTTESENEIA